MSKESDEKPSLLLVAILLAFIVLWAVDIWSSRSYKVWCISEEGLMGIQYIVKPGSGITPLLDKNGRPATCINASAAPLPEPM